MQLTNKQIYKYTDSQKSQIAIHILANSQIHKFANKQISK